jgi:hypothetical protein
VRALKIVDFPTLGRPTIPQFNGIVCCFLDTRLDTRLALASWVCLLQDSASAGSGFEMRILR